MTSTGDLIYSGLSFQMAVLVAYSGYIVAYSFMMGKSRADCVIPVLFLVAKCYPGEVPDSFLKVMFSSSPFLGKSGSSEGVRKVNVGVTSRNLVVFDCDIMRSTSNCLSNEHDNHRIFDHAGVLDGMLPSKTTANQVSQTCISKLWLRVIHVS